MFSVHKFVGVLKLSQGDDTQHYSKQNTQSRIKVALADHRFADVENLVGIRFHKLRLAVHWRLSVLALAAGRNVSLTPLLAIWSFT